MPPPPLPRGRDGRRWPGERSWCRRLFLGRARHETNRSVRQAIDALEPGAPGPVFFDGDRAEIEHHGSRHENALRVLGVELDVDFGVAELAAILFAALRELR